MDGCKITYAIARVSLLLKALLQNWHLYFLSGARQAFREASVAEAEVGRLPRLRQAWLLMCHVRARVKQLVPIHLNGVDKG